MISPIRFIHKHLEIAFIDPNLEDYQTLISGIDSKIQVVLLDSKRDGVQEITQILKTDKFAAVHIISHGSPGTVYLGNAILNLNSLVTKYASLLQQWRDYLVPGADILLYGCQIAASSIATTFLQLLHQLTGANIAASANLTGQAALGGDWELEVCRGEIAVPLAVRPDVREAYQSVFATITVTSTNDNTNVDGVVTLREAILSANNNAAINADVIPVGAFGTDVIDFKLPGVGPFTIAPTTALPTITDPVSINGYSQVGAVPNTAVNGNNAILNIEINGANAGVTNGLVVSGGNSTIQGLVINGFSGNGILVTGNANNIIRGNFIGTNVAGTAASSNLQSGIQVLNSFNNTIGGSNPSDRNLISGNNNSGITVQTGATGNLIQGNYIGTDFNGTDDIGNRLAGVLLTGGANGNIIQNNTISNNHRLNNQIFSNNANVVILEASNNNVVAGNFIGTNATGNAISIGSPFPHGGPRGVLIQNSTGNVIGGSTAGDRNIISGNQHTGIELVDPGANNNRIQGNYIGTDVTGNQALGNGNAGIQLFLGPQNNIIGTDSNGVNDAQEGNLISGNGQVVTGTGDGVVLVADIADPTQNNILAGNFIGTNAAGTAALGNARVGLLFQNSANNTIGGTTPAARNLISGNQSEGLYLIGDNTINNQIEGNYIGTDIDGTADLGNRLAGLSLVGGASNNTVRNNTISNNNRLNNQIFSNNANVQILQTSNNNVVTGNFIGTNATGNAISTGTPFPNGGPRGVLIQNSTGNVIGGSTAGDRNIVSGNQHTGIELVGLGANNNRIQGNYIGTDVTGNQALGNGNAGIQIFFGPQNNLFGTDSDGVNDAQEGNVISGNGQVVTGTGDGVVLAGNVANPSQNNILAGNFIGTNAAGTAALGNARLGLFFQDGVNNTVGGTVPAARNLISSNQNHGVFITGNNAINNQIEGNYIGTDINGTVDLGNRLVGVLLNGGANNNTIQNNIISNNDAQGVSIAPNGGGNRILSNSIFNNAGLGIDLNNDGVTLNDTDDTDTGANNLQNFPQILAAEPVGNSTVVLGTFASFPNTTYRLEFFSNLTADPSGNGEGQTYRDFTTVTTDANGKANFTFTIPVSLAGQFITTTATNTITNDTSEFSNAREVVTPTLTLTPNALSQNEGNTGATPYSYTVTLSQPSSQDITVNYLTSEGTATVADDDFGVINSSLTFTASNIFNLSTPFDPANLSQAFAINVNGDPQFELDETLTVSLQNPVNANLSLNNSQAISTLVNDDLQPTVSLSPATVSQAEGNSGTSVYTYTVTLSNPSFQPITVNYSTQDGTATVADLDYVANTGSIIFNPGDPLIKTIPVTVQGDTKLEPNETFTLNLESATNVQLDATALSATGVLVSDETQAVISINDVTVTEGNTGSTNATFTVTLSQPSFQPVSVNYATADGTATAEDSDYGAIAPTSLDFAPGETSKTLSVAVKGDIGVELDETFKVTLSGATNGAIAKETGIGTILNDDAPTPTPTPTPVPVPTATPTPTPVPTSTPAPTATLTPVLTETPTPIPTETPTPVPTETPTPVPTETPTPVPTETPTPVPTETPTPVPTVTPTPVLTETPTPVPTVTPTPVPTVTPQITLPVVQTFSPEEIDCVCNAIVRPNLNQPNPGVQASEANEYLFIETSPGNTFFGDRISDIVHAKVGDNNLFGGDVSDSLNGNEGNDFISGGPGDDLLFGGKNNDIILGNEGNDLIFGNLGKDSIHGREENDILAGNEGQDYLEGGKGDDILFGGKDTDLILGSEGNDSLYGNLGDDTMCGGKGNDFLSGNENNDRIGGCEGNDTLYGGKNEDTLWGCEGNDILFGDYGSDLLIGGLGNDTFGLQLSQGLDIIADFQKGQDILGLSPGLTFEQLEIVGENNNTLIKIKTTGIAIASLTGVNALLIGISDFQSL